MVAWKQPTEAASAITATADLDIGALFLYLMGTIAYAATRSPHGENVQIGVARG